MNFGAKAPSDKGGNEPINLGAKAPFYKKDDARLVGLKPLLQTTQDAVRLIGAAVRAATGRRPSSLLQVLRCF